jgi:hypothetical protein
MLYEIGETAGSIWRTLEEEGPLRLSTLKRQIKVPDALFFMAIGWLARENKLVFEAEGRGFNVRLK